MEPVTLIATDLDGTFLNSKKQVSDLNREAVSKLKNHGILFGIASGRPVAVSYTHLDVYKRQALSSVTQTIASVVLRHADAYKANIAAIISCLLYTSSRNESGPSCDWIMH